MNFLWGVATSAYQIEGGIENDWSAWERSGRLRAAHERCGRATDHHRLWEGDLALVPAIGANAFRFSVEWARIEPRPGEYDIGALEMYRSRIVRLRELGIEPVVTLFHYTHPVWFWDHGWESSRAVDAFAGFARRCAEAFGELVDIYTLVNEPLVFMLGGYLDGSIPPGRKEFSAGVTALENLLRAHAAAAAEFREVNPAARFGLAHNMMDFAADRPGSIADRWLAESADRLYNRALLEAMATGRAEIRIPSVGSRELRVDELPGAVDFVGVNYYSRLHVRLTLHRLRLWDVTYRDRRGAGLTDTGWEIHPEGLARMIAIAAGTGLPVLITENGIATRDDTRRADFLREHTLVVRDALSRGVDLRGYLYWSLLDNFEWLDGFGPRFGLYEVDYPTFARRRRRSADLFEHLGRQFLRAEFTPV